MAKRAASWALVSGPAALGSRLLGPLRGHRGQAGPQRQGSAGSYETRSALPRISLLSPDLGVRARSAGDRLGPGEVGREMRSSPTLKGRLGTKASPGSLWVPPRARPGLSQAETPPPAAPARTSLARDSRSGPSLPLPEVTRHRRLGVSPWALGHRLPD